MHKNNQEQMVVREIKKGLLKWYDFDKNSKVLYVGFQEDPIAEMLISDSLQVEFVSIEEIYTSNWVTNHQNFFDYVILIEIIEKETQPTRLLSYLSKVISIKGKLLLGMNNRFGMRYFCGDRDPYTDRNFDGIQGYARAYIKKEDTFLGRMYNKAEITKMLVDSGWKNFHFYSVMPNIAHPSLLFEENFLPNEDLSNRLFPMYRSPEAIFLEEESLYSGLIDNQMFHQMANAYLVECTMSGELSEVLQVTSSLGRGFEDAMITISKKSSVEKRAVYKEGDIRLHNLIKNGNALRKNGIKTVDAKIENNVYYMPYIHAEVGQMYLKKLLLSDIDKFLVELDRFRSLILKSSTIEQEDCGDGEGAILSHGYIDMVPLNSFFIDGEFVFYDQEFCQKHYPANVIITRMISTFYAGNVEFHKILPINDLFERYNLNKRIEHWIKCEIEFLTKLRNEELLFHYYRKHRINAEVTHANRQAINYSIDQYIRLFIDIFRNADTRKLVLFGAGAFTKKFMEIYSLDYPVYAIVDNQKDKWGMQIEGIEIKSPEILKELKSGEFKVLVCIKNYVSVVKQLLDMGVSEYSIFDAYKDYPRKRIEVAANETNGDIVKSKKKYHTGYVAGVFDLFHIGHLNMFKRAKEECDFLIVGVVSDERTKKIKGSDPFIPFKERLEIVKSCRYVDQVIEIPLNYGNSSDVFRTYHFDCQFSGSDYEDHPGWLAEKTFLENNGADLVFFPYSEETSSTKIKGLIKSKLI